MSTKAPSPPRTGRNQADLAIDAVTLAAVFALVTAVHIAVVGRIPTGSDPGNWLALGRQIAGEDVMAASVSYPPVVPSLMAMLSRVFSPIEALAAVGIASRLAVGFAAYVVLRRANRAAAVFGASLCLFAGYQSEIFAFGGYPQLIGTAGAMLALHAVVRFMRNPHLLALAATLVFSALTAITHTFSSAVLLGAVAVATMLLLVSGEVANRLRTISLAIAALVPASIVTVVWIVTPSLSGNPTTNPQGFGYGEAARLLGSVVRESPLAWAILAAGAAVALVLSARLRRVEVPVQAAAWIASGAIVWIVFLEHRSLAFAQIGIILAVAILPGLLAEGNYRRAVPVTAAILILVAGSVAAIRGAQRFEGAVGFYRVVGTTELQTLRELEDLSNIRDVVLSSRGRNDHHLGWWVQGYAGRPAITSANPSYLAFPEERHHAAIAQDIFQGDLDTQEFLAISEEHGIRYVVVDRLGPDAAWLTSPAAMALTRVVNGLNLVVLRVP